MPAPLKKQPYVAPGECANDSAIRLSEVISAMSYALDLVGGHRENHAVRTAIIGQHLAMQLKLDTDTQSALFYAALLKDLGCSSNAARMCSLFQADERKIKHDIRLIDWTSQLTTARFSMSNARRGGSFTERLKAVLGIAVNKEEASRGLINVRCQRGADITSMLGFPQQTADAILALDEHWNGNGQPLGLSGSSIPLVARICSLSQTLEVFITEHGIDAACRVATQRRGKWFDPEIVSAFSAIARAPEFLAAIHHTDSRQVLQSLEPHNQVRWVDEEKYDRVALAFSQVIDAKSPWTLRHSEGVAMIAVGIADTLGLSSVHAKEIHRAGLLHDIGKLGVSNLVLDKPGKLTDEEFSQMQSHTRYTQSLLKRVSVFERFADYASAHHERLDGTGYHRGLKGGEITLEARILAVADVCEALTADRPYREGMSAEQTLAIITADSGSAFCPEVVEAFAHYQDSCNLFEQLKNRPAP